MRLVNRRLCRRTAVQPLRGPYIFKAWVAAGACSGSTQSRAHSAPCTFIASPASSDMSTLTRALTGRPLLSSGTRTRGRGQRGVCCVTHPPQRAGMQDEVGSQGPVNRSCLGYDAGDCLACVWVALDVAFSDGFLWYISEHVPAQGRADYSVVDHLRWFVCRVEGDYGQLVQCPPLPHDDGHGFACTMVRTRVYVLQCTYHGTLGTYSSTYVHTCTIAINHHNTHTCALASRKGT
jgi:hypothetical protein